MAILTRIPVLVKHMTLAIFDDLQGSPKDRFVNAFQIARGRLVQYRFLTAPSERCEHDKMVLTAKGLERNTKHLRETGHALKTKRFDLLYGLHLTTAEQQDDVKAATDKEKKS